jgi:hypothetical protein
MEKINIEKGFNSKAEAILEIAKEAKRIFGKKKNILSGLTLDECAEAVDVIIGDAFKMFINELPLTNGLLRVFTVAKDNNNKIEKIQEFVIADNAFMNNFSVNESIAIHPNITKIVQNLAYVSEVRRHIFQPNIRSIVVQLPILGENADENFDKVVKEMKALGFVTLEEIDALSAQKQPEPANPCKTTEVQQVFDFDMDQPAADKA